ncbi:hypothetical protein RND81_05G109200 [Saponaria officinalis]|uniref:Uncharacterized protein n=1 Tax=Saponaria officinalis TaxID=3572 RepID=A0AAW1KZX7_SAPOF
MEGSKVMFDKFDGKDFAFRKMQITDYLYSKNMHLPLEGSKPDFMEKAEWKKLDRQTLGVVRLTLARNVAFNVMSAATTVDPMNARRICMRNHLLQIRYSICVDCLLYRCIKEPRWRIMLMIIM